MRDPLDMELDFMTPRKLTLDQVESESNNQSSSIKKVGSSNKKKMSTAGFNLYLSALKNKKWKARRTRWHWYMISLQLLLRVWNKSKIRYGRIEEIILRVDSVNTASKGFCNDPRLVSAKMDFCLLGMKMS